MRRATRWIARALAVAGLAGVAGIAAAEPDGAPSEFEATLLGLAERALEAGDLETARDRYGRVLDANPGSAPALVGLGTVARRGGDAEAARRRYEAALELEPTLVAAHLGMTELAMARGDPATARRHVEAALEGAPHEPLLHQRRFELTGLAPPPALASLAEGVPPARVRELAAAHPYDPRVQLALAKLALASEDPGAARRALEASLLTADLAPRAAPEAARLLAGLDGDETVRFVAVHSHADESVRAVPGWRFELRMAWGRASATLAPLLETVFVPVSFHGFASEASRPDLPSIHAAMLAAGPRPQAGIMAGFTRREAPRTRLARREGQARFLGNELVVRLDPDDREGRTLAHEVLHLYGAIHLSDEVESVMNPAGGALRLDPYNARIVSVTRERGFASGAVEQDVLARVDQSALADALLAAIRVNVHFRNAGIREALEEARTSRVVASRHARRAMGQDRHLAEVAYITAHVLIRVERPAEGVLMMEKAGRLFGPRTARGRAALGEADRWRAAYKAYLRR